MERAAQNECAFQIERSFPSVQPLLSFRFGLFVQKTLLCRLRVDGTRSLSPSDNPAQPPITPSHPLGLVHPKIPALQTALALNLGLCQRQERNREPLHPA